MTNVKQIADYQNLCGECPVWDPEAGLLYWTDNSSPKLYSYEPATGRHGLCHEGITISGFRLNQPGGFVIANGSGIWLWDGAAETKLICDAVEGARCQINDCAADPKGRLIAGSAFYDPSRQYELGKLFIVDTDGTAKILDEDIQLSNGLAFSPDGSTLYFADSADRIIYRYDYRASGGTVSNRRVFVKVPDDEGLPDGLCVDADAHVWSAQWFGSCIVRYDPDGKVERRIAVPAKQTSSLAFGGPDLTDIFITTASFFEPMPILPRGYDATGIIGGALYHVNAGILGKPEYLANITLAG